LFSALLDRVFAPRHDVKQTDSKLLRAIEEAIHRIDQGTYGICLECENEIAPARHEAVPWTRVCIDCKAKQQNG